MLKVVLIVSLMLCASLLVHGERPARQPRRARGFAQQHVCHRLIITSPALSWQLRDLATLRL
jgi:hypothetical protein